MRNHNGDEKTFPAIGLRSAGPEDEEFLLNLFASTRADELLLLERPQRDVLIAMQFKAQSGQFFMVYPQARNTIILWNDEPVGRMLIDRGEAEFTLVDIALLPAHRNHGIGTHLLKDLIAEALAAGKPIQLHVGSSNSAKRLYERLGFSEVGGDAVYLKMRWVPQADCS